MTWAESVECAKCGRSFASRNKLFRHLRESQSCGSGLCSAGPSHEEVDPSADTSPSQKESTDFSGSTSTGHRRIDDDSPAPRSSEDKYDNEVSGSHVETPPVVPVSKSTVGESVYDIYARDSLHLE